MTSYKTNHLPKAPSLHIITQGVSASEYEFWRGTIQSIAQYSIREEQH